jgi:AcrR family transcriptional regulator
VPERKPRKLPRQARSRASFEAIVEACARLLPEHGYAALSTNQIAERAGVGIGTLYEFFPNKESIVALLIERRFEGARSVEALRAGADAPGGVEALIRGVLARIERDRAMFAVLIREVPFFFELPAVRAAVDGSFALARAAARRPQARLNLPHPDEDAWLVARMVYHAVLEIALVDDETLDRSVLIDELVRLLRRMLHGREESAER